MDNLNKIFYTIIRPRDAQIYKSIISLFIILNLAFVQEIPDTSIISWVQDEFTIVDSSIYVELCWQYLVGRK